MTDTMTEDRRIVHPVPSMALVYVTPQIAVSFLAKSDVNRKLSRERAKWLAECFKRGEHRLTGDAISFTPYDLMDNGQHRMLAVVIADLDHGLPFWVQYGAVSGSQLVTDTGRQRSFADQLRIREIKNATAVSAATKLLWQYQTGVMKDIKTWQSRLSPSVMQMWEFFQEHQKEVTDTVTRASSIRHVIPFSQSVLMVAQIVLFAIDETDAEGFFNELGMRTQQSEGVQLLTAYMLKHKVTRRGTTGWHTGIDSRMQLALLFKAWNHYRNGITPRAISFRTGGASPEAMPVPR